MATTTQSDLSVCIGGVLRDSPLPPLGRRGSPRLDANTNQAPSLRPHRLSDRAVMGTERLGSQPRRSVPPQAVSRHRLLLRRRKLSTRSESSSLITLSLSTGTSSIGAWEATTPTGASRRSSGCGTFPGSERPRKRLTSRLRSAVLSEKGRPDLHGSAHDHLVGRERLDPAGPDAARPARPLPVQHQGPRLARPGSRLALPLARDLHRLDQRALILSGALARREGAKRPAEGSRSRPRQHEAVRRGGPEPRPGARTARRRCVRGSRASGAASRGRSAPGDLVRWVAPDRQGVRGGHCGRVSFWTSSWQVEG